MTENFETMPEEELICRAQVYDESRATVEAERSTTVIGRDFLLIKTGIQQIS